MSTRKSHLPIRESRNTLTPYGSEGLRPSSSSRKCLSSISLYVKNKSPNRKNKIPINDKEWQNNAFTKIKQYINTLDPDVKLHPLSTPIFIYVTNLLLRTKVESEIDLTKENYQAEIPLILNILEYPSTVSASILKNPNIPHSFPVILAIWSFILDLDTSSKSIFENCPEGTVYLDFCMKSLFNVDLQIDSVSEDLNKIYAINEVEQASLKVDVENMMNDNGFKLKQIEELMETQLATENEEREMQEKICEVEKITSSYEDQFAALKEIDEELDNNLERLTKVNLDFKIRLDEIESKDLSDFKNKVAESANTLRLFEEKRDYNMNKIGNLDKSMIEMRRDVETSIVKLNNDILDFCLDVEETKELMAPTTGFGRPDVIKEFQKVLRNWLGMIQRSEQKKTDLAKINVENNQMTLKLAMRQSYLTLLEDKGSKMQEKVTAKFDVLQEKIMHSVNEYEEVQKNTVELTLIKSNLEQVKLNYKVLVKAYETSIEDWQVRYNEFSEIIWENVKEMNDVITHYTELVKMDVDESLKRIETLNEILKDQSKRNIFC